MRAALRPRVVIGVGNSMRHDDGVGPVAVDMIRARQLTGTDTTVSCGDATRLVYDWQERDLAIVIDAIAAGAAPGTIHRVRYGEDSFPQWCAGTSSHGAGLAEAVELARALDRLPAELVVVGVEPADLSPGPGLSPVVETALRSVVDTVVALLETPR